MLRVCSRDLLQFGKGLLPRADGAIGCRYAVAITLCLQLDMTAYGEWYR
jgi:hypothetical protein